ncbi:MAG TPA: NAD(P)H-dependent oxidoreductase subunit E [Desulfuromonadaceae bacterium]
MIRRLDQTSSDELIEVLHATQQHYGYLENDHLAEVAEKLRLPPALVYGVASFYHLFRLSPPGKQHCTVCTGTSCHLKGGTLVLQELEKRLGIACGETTSDGLFSLGSVRCVGVCGRSPLAICGTTMLSGFGPDDLADKVCLHLAQSVTGDLTDDRR